MSMAHPVLRLPANTAGRDFVVGDIHGAYDLVIAAMRAVRFDRTRDRLFCVGDLVDRGAGSARCLGFLSQPYVHAIRGNHDHDLTTIDHRTAQVLAGINFNGTAWLEDVTEEQFLSIQSALAQLPFAMEVQTARGLVGIVHGDVPAGLSWQEFTQRLEEGDEKTIEIALTGRDRLRAHRDEGVEGIGRVFVGHTVQWQGARRLGNVYAVDTGAVFREVFEDGRGALSMTNLTCTTGALFPPADEARRPVELYDRPGEGPFGDYARPRCR